MDQDSKSGSGSGKAKPPPRRNTEARREQNRIASHNYRQKRKQKLALLDKLTAEEPESQSASTFSRPSALPDGLAGLSLTQGDDDHIDVIGHGIHRDLRNRSIESALTDHGWDFLDSNDPSSQPTGSNGALIRAGDSLGSFIATLGESAVIPTTTTTTTLVPGTRMNDLDEQTRTLARVLEGIQGLSHTQKKELLLHLQLETGELPGRSFPSSSYSSSASSSSSSNCSTKSQPHTHPAKIALQEMARRFGVFAWRYSSGQVGPAQLSQLYARDAGFYAAIVTNFYALGMKDTEQLTGEEGVSPFSIDQDTGYHSSQLAALRPKFRSISTDLQPIDTQFIVGHHPYLDVIPYRIFRDKALRAMQQDPPLFDEDELCDDFSKGAMVCWGSQQNSLGMEAGVPWDVRSWEPQAWFLRKYWFLVGDWDDEMWKSARWWHDMRGEILSVT